MKLTTIVLVASLLPATSILAQTIVSVAALPPVVVKTVPQSGELTVDRTLKEIRVTFSKDMMTNEMWSWVQIDAATFPRVTSKARFLDDKRTCILPVQLAPARTYAVWINSEEHRNFRDLGNRPAVPYLLVFQTRP